VRAAIVLLMKNPGGPTGVGVCSGDAGVYSGEATGEMARRGEAGSTTFSCCSLTLQFERAARVLKSLLGALAALRAAAPLSWRVPRLA
jgi:hypothetical protein